MTGQPPTKGLFVRKLSGYGQPFLADRGHWHDHARRRLMFHALSAIAEFGRDLIRERVIAGIRRAQAQGRHVGRPPKYRVDSAVARGLLAGGASLRGAARSLGVHPSAIGRALGSAPS